MFNIAKFSGNLNKHGTLQTNKFYVDIPPPRIFSPSEIQEVIRYRASNVRVPGAALDVQRVFRYGVGPEQKFATNINFTDINITFIDTVNKDLWKKFTIWMNDIFDFTGLRGGGIPTYKTEYKQYYTTDIKIHIFDNEGIERNVVVLKEAFPTTLSEVGLSWSENNRVYEFSMGFAFTEWYYESYAVQPYESNAIIGPELSALPIPRRVEPPRPAPGGSNDPGGGANLATGPVSP
jgi:hypothetical protein